MEFLILKFPRRLAGIMLLSVAMLACGVLAKAQSIYPVTVLQTPPANFGSLADVTSATGNSWTTTLLLNDLNETSLQVAIRVRLESNNFSAQTRNPLLAPVQILQRGMPLVLTSTDLAAYLAPGNLEVQGIDINSFLASGSVLPEGAYELCVEVYPLSRPNGSPIGGQGCQAVLATSYDPPVITSPYVDEQVLPTDPQFLVFSWMHRGIVPGGVQYDFELYPVEPAQMGMSVDDIVNFGRRIVTQQVISQTTYSLTLADPQLEFGWDYVVRVKAIDPSGQSRFVNNGFSRPVRFRYGVGGGGSNCPGVSNLSLLHIGNSDAIASWVLPPPADGGPAYSAIDVEVRLRDDPSQKISYSADAVATEQLVQQLVPGVEYELAVRGICQTGPSATQVIAFTAGSAASTDFTGGGTCAAPGESLVDTTVSSGQQLKPGSIFNLHSFQVKVVEVTGDPTAGYTGKGSFIVPFLEQGILAVDFTSIKVNATGKATAGEVSPMRSSVAKFDPTQYAANFGDTNCGAAYTEDDISPTGFLPTGSHYVTGEIYDPNGFDVDGNYIGTQLPIPQNLLAEPRQQFDPQGWSQNGENESTGNYWDANGCDRFGFRLDTLANLPYGAPTGIPCDASGFNGQQIIEEYTEFATGLPGNGNGSLGGAVINFAIDKTGSPGWVKQLGNAIAQGEIPDWEQTVVAVAMPYVSEAIGLEAEDAQRLYNLSRAVIDVTVDAEAIRQRTGLPAELLWGEDNRLLTDAIYSEFPNGLPEALPPAGRNPDILAYEAELEKRYNGAVTIKEETQPTLNVSVALNQADALDFLKGIAEGVLKSITLKEGQRLVSDPAGLLVPFLREKFKIQIRLEVDRLVELKRQQRAGAGQGGQGSGWLSPKHPLQDVKRGSLPPPSFDEAWASIDDGWEDIPVAKLSELSPPDFDAYRQFFPPPSASPLFGYKLPLVIGREVEGEEYLIVIDDLRIPASTANDGAVKLDIYTALKAPDSEYKMLVFQAVNVPMSAGGFARDTMQISLANAVRFGLGEVGTISLDPPANASQDPAAYVNFTCEGYAGFGLRADLEFCRDLVMPYDEQTKAPKQPTFQANSAVVADPATYTVGIEVQGQRWPHFYGTVRGDRTNNGNGVQVSERFVVTSYQDVVWQADQLVIDASELATPQGLNFQAGYLVTDYDTWQGVYLSDIGAELVGFVERSDGSGPRATLTQGIIDDQGVTLKLAGSDLLGLDEGKIGDWAMSVEAARVELYKNSLTEVYLRGQVELPTDDSDIVGYEGQYLVANAMGLRFTMSPPDNAIDWDIWGAELSLNSASKFTIAKDANTGVYFAGAELFGKIDIGIAGEALSLDDIEFLDFRLYSRAPYIDLAQASAHANGSAKLQLKAFTFEVTKLGLRGGGFPDAPADYGLTIGGLMGMMKGSYGFGIGTDVTVWGDVTTSPDISLDYVDYTVDAVKIAVQIPGVFVDGGLAWKKGDTVWGSGFHGRLKAFVTGLDAGLAASGTFGSTNYGHSESYKYWSVDIAVLFGPSQAPLVFPPVALTAAGGGLSWHMDRDTTADQTLDLTTMNPNKPLVFGESISGINYLPSHRVSVNARIMCGLGIKGSYNVATLDAGLEISFSNSGGLNFISLDGAAEFARSVDPLSNQPIAPFEPPVVTASLNITLADGTDGYQLSGNLRAWLNAAGGTVTGASSYGGRDDYFGAIELFFSKRDWYLWLGTPENPLGVKMDVQGRAGLKITTYLDAGSKLPPWKALPPKYSSLGINSHISSSGGGFAHGTEVSLKGSTKSESGQGSGSDGDDDGSDDLLYVSYQMEAGYNVLVSGGNSCPTQSSYGMNGWRLAGAAYIGGSVTASIDVPYWFDVELGQGSLLAAAVLEGPNNFSGNAAAQLDFKLLGGYVDYAWSGNVKFGKRCNGAPQPPPPWAGPLPKEILTALTPIHGATDVDPGERIEASFTHPYNQWTTVQIPDPRNASRKITKQIKPTVDFTVYKLSNGQRDGSLAGSSKVVAGYPKRVQWIADQRFLYGTEYEIVTYARVYERPQGSSGPGQLFKWGGHTYENYTSSTFTVGSIDVPDLVTATSIQDGEQGYDQIDPFLITLRDVPFEIEKADGSFQTFQAKVMSVRLMQKIASGATPSGLQKFVEVTHDGNVATVELGELRENTGYRLIIRSSVVHSNGVALWDTENNGDYEQRLVLNFKTGLRPQTISPANIFAAYPYRNQYNTYLFEEGTEQWFIELKNDQEYLLTGTTGERENPLAVNYLPADGNSQEPDSLALYVRYRDAYSGQLVGQSRATYTASAAGGRAWVSWPTPQRLGLQPGAIYEYELTKYAVAGLPSVPLPNFSSNATSQPPEVFGELGDVLYTDRFRVSHYPTMADKLLALGNTTEHQMQGYLTPDFPVSASGKFAFPPNTTPGTLVSPPSSDCAGFVSNWSYRELGTVLAKASPTGKYEAFSRRELMGLEAGPLLTNMSGSAVTDPTLRGANSGSFPFPSFAIRQLAGAAELSPNATLEDVGVWYANPPAAQVQVYQAVAIPAGNLFGFIGHGGSPNNASNSGPGPVAIPAEPVVILNTASSYQLPTLTPQVYTRGCPTQNYVILASGNLPGAALLSYAIANKQVETLRRSDNRDQSHYMGYLNNGALARALVPKGGSNAQGSNRNGRRSKKGKNSRPGPNSSNSSQGDEYMSRWLPSVNTYMDPAKAPTDEPKARINYTVRGRGGIVTARHTTTVEFNR